MHFLFIATLCLGLPIPDDSGIDRPSIRVDSREHDFGPISGQETVGHTFRLKNMGDSPLLIHKVEGDRNCLIVSGCHVPELAPGGHFGLQVRFSPRALANEQSREILVHSNDPDIPVLVLALRANVQVDFELESYLARFRNVRVNDRLRESIRIESYMNQPLLFTHFACSHDFISASLRKGDRDGSYYLDVEVDGRRLPGDVDRITGKIEFETNSMRNPAESISVVATTYEDLNVRPRMLSAQGLELGKEYLTRVILRRSEDAAYSLNDVHFTNNDIDVREWNTEGDTVDIVYALNETVRNDSIIGQFQLNLILEKPLVVTIPFSGFIAEESIAKLNLKRRSGLAKSVERKAAKWLSDLCHLDRSEMPRITVDQEYHDFGTVKMGKMPETAFIISNHGDGDLVIEGVHSSHDCIATDMSRLVIPPGKREALTVALKTMNRRPNYHEAMVIHSNDPLSQEKKLEIMADIHADFRIRRPSFAFRDVREGMILKDRIKVQSYMDEPLKFHDIKSDYDFIECSFSKGSEDDIYYLDLKADLRGRELTPGPLSGKVKFKTNSPQLPEGDVGFFMNIIQDIKAEPQKVILYRLGRSAKDEQILKLTNVLDKRFTVTDISLDLDCVDIELLNEGRTTSDIRLRINETVAEGRYQAKMTITLDYKTPEFLEIPVEVMIRR